MDNCDLSGCGACYMGMLVNVDIGSRYSWSSCNNGGKFFAFDILLNNALVENAVAKFKRNLHDWEMVEFHNLLELLYGPDTSNTLLDARRWQESDDSLFTGSSFIRGAVAVLLLLAVGLLCAYELCAVYVTAGVRASERYSPSGFFFGVSAISLAINMLFICRMVFNGNGLDVDEYVRRAYKFAYSDCIEVGPVACLQEPPDPNELYPRQSRRSASLKSYIPDEVLPHAS
ncbi:hypothetical protein FXO37_09943 [Capsicum annuum]|nr:hypothetical protein FXO37_09943 [Capsicum annuum]